MAGNDPHTSVLCNDRVRCFAGAKKKDPRPQKLINTAIKEDLLAVKDFLADPDRGVK